MTSSNALQPGPLQSARYDALVELGRMLQARGYRFTTITPASHARVVATKDVANDARDVFGWSLPFDPHDDALAPFVPLLRTAGALVVRGPLARAGVRCSTLGDHLFFHSAFPTTEPDAVFFGPDTYRFCALLDDVVPARAGRVVDIGAGTGAAGIHLRARADSVVLADVNPRALDACRVNAALAGVDVEIVASDVLRQVPGAFDLIVANPPYLVDPALRAYRHGGPRGVELALRIVRESLPRLAPGGRLVVYTGAPVRDGVDDLQRDAAALVQGLRWRCVELDPDVFGEELGKGAYTDVERISLVALIVDARPSAASNHRGLA